MGDLLITVAPTGAETTKESCPALPTTLTELVETAKRCEAAGAAMIHVHIRDDEHRPTLDQGRLKETVAALKQETGLVVQLSTGGSVHDPLESRLRVLDAEPDSCSLAMGTTNFGDDVFHTVIRRTVKFPETTVAGEPITTYASASKGADAYRMLAREVLRKCR